MVKTILRGKCSDSPEDGEDPLCDEGGVVGADNLPP